MGQAFDSDHCHQADHHNHADRNGAPAEPDPRRTLTEPIFHNLSSNFLYPSAQPLGCALKEKIPSILKHSKPESRITTLNGQERMVWVRSEEHTSELQSRGHLVCR